MKGFVRASAALLIWFCVLSIFAAGWMAFNQWIERYSRQIPMAVILPDEMQSTERDELSAELSGAGADVEFISRDAGLAALQDIVTDAAADAESTDTELLTDLPENPLPSMLIVRCSRPEQYPHLAALVRERMPLARMKYDGVAADKIAARILFIRRVATLTTALLTLLFMISAASMIHGFLHALRLAAASAGLAVISIGFAFSFASENSIVREIGLDWKFAAGILSAWVLLIIVAALARLAFEKNS